MICVCIWMSCVFHVLDAILIPTPFYGVITEDLHLYSDVKLFHVPLDCEVGKKKPDLHAVNMFPKCLFNM